MPHCVLKKRENMPRERDESVVEIDGLRIKESGLYAATAVIAEWERTGGCDTTEEVIAIYRIISDAIVSPDIG